MKSEYQNKPPVSDGSLRHGPFDAPAPCQPVPGPEAVPRSARPDPARQGRRRALAGPRPPPSAEPSHGAGAAGRAAAAVPPRTPGPPRCFPGRLLRPGRARGTERGLLLRRGKRPGPGGKGDTGRGLPSRGLRPGPLPSRQVAAPPGRPAGRAGRALGCPFLGRCGRTPQRPAKTWRPSPLPARHLQTRHTGAPGDRAEPGPATPRPAPAPQRPAAAPPSAARRSRPLPAAGQRGTSLPREGRDPPPLPPPRRGPGGEARGPAVPPSPAGRPLPHRHLPLPRRELRAARPPPVRAPTVRGPSPAKLPSPSLPGAAAPERRGLPVPPAAPLGRLSNGSGASCGSPTPVPSPLCAAPAPDTTYYVRPGAPLAAAPCLRTEPPPPAGAEGRRAALVPPPPPGGGSAGGGAGVGDDAEGAAGPGRAVPSPPRRR